MFTELERLVVAKEVVVRLGRARAVESSKAQASAIPNPLGAEYIGVDDFNGRTYRARIRVCDALSGNDKRVTLGRFGCAEDAAFAYRAGHVALYGSFSWANDTLSEGERWLVDTTRKEMMLE
jgi:hypothetical protein